MQTIFLVGPTAVGKSAVALELARRLDAEIVSADSMQVYRGMDIGTAKPTPAERKEIRHHLIDVCDVNEVFDVKRFVDTAQTALAGIHKRGKTALVVGGTGMYVRALRRGLFEGPGRDPALRAKLEMVSVETLAAELDRVDPVTASKIDRKNPRRLVRALEVFYVTGKPIAEMQNEWTTAEPTPNPSQEGNRNSGLTSEDGNRRSGLPSTGGVGGGFFGLVRQRADLIARIERRIDEQIAAGWVQEVHQILDRLARFDATAVASSRTSLHAVGYREIAAHLRGELSLPETVALIKTRTRQLAKRQMTWFRREPDLVWVEMRADETVSETAARIVREAIPSR